jgi:putative redox protein
VKATARRTDGYKHQIKIRDHELVIDEPTEEGGADAGPSPQEMLAASLASCVAITIEMYADRKGWDVSGLEVDCDYTPAERGALTRFEMTIRVPTHLDEEQRQRLAVIAAKCPVHRTLEGEVEFEERVEIQP